MSWPRSFNQGGALHHTEGNIYIYIYLNIYVVAPRVNERSSGTRILWRCIAYWEWGYSIAILVFLRLSGKSIANWVIVCYNGQPEAEKSIDDRNPYCNPYHQGWDLTPKKQN